MRKDIASGIESWKPNLKSGLSLLPSAGLRIVLHGTTQLQQHQDALNAFIVAANRWEAIISTRITVVIDVDFGPTFFGQTFPSGVLGATSTSSVTQAFPDVRQRLIDSASSPNEQELYNALPASVVPVELNGGAAEASSVKMTLPNARALGIVPDITDPDSLPAGQGDAGIGFNSAFQFDFVPDDGVTPGVTDFDSVASHEIGHALGFISNSGGGSSSPLSIWDLFRFRPAAASLATFATAPRVNSLGGEQVYFNNRASTFATQELSLSTGGPNPGPRDGDGQQSSHWKDDALLSTRPYLGVMDPTLARGLRRTISENDINALDLFGYSIGGPPRVRPANDNFADASALQTSSGSLAGSNTNATREANEPIHVGYLGDKSVWYSWFSPINGVMTIDTIGSNFDTTLAVYAGSTLSQLIAVAQNDDIVAGTNKVSRVDFDLNAGTTYWIAVDGWNGEFGNVTLNWTSTGSIPSPITTTQSVAYQIDAAHTGAQSDPITPPLTVRWSRDLGGSISTPISYPLIAGGRVFVAAQGRLYALDTATGATLWGPVNLGGTPGLAYDNGRVFAVNFTGLLQAFDAVSGTMVWSKQLPQYSYFAPPTARGGLVYVGGFGSGGTLSAVSEQNGTIRWNAGLNAGGSSSPAISPSAVFASYSCDTSSRSPYIGTLTWEHISCSGGEGRTPALFGGRLYVRDSNSGNRILNANTGADLGSFSSNSLIPAFSGTIGYFLTGRTLEARDTASQAFLWSFTGDGTLSSAPIVDNGYVYIASETGKLYALSATTGANVWTGTLGAAVYSPNERNSQPLSGLGAADGLVVVPADNLLVAFQSSQTITFSAPSYTVNEGDGQVSITVTRSGDTNSAASVRYETNDASAKEGRDYTAAYGVLTFAPGEASKTFALLLIDNVYVDGDRTVNLKLSHSTGANLSAQTTALLTIRDNDNSPPTANPLDTARFFVQQHYYDFLNRYPDQGGWDYWTSQLTQCGSDATCIHNKSVDTSNAFFFEQEYQQTAANVFRLYRAAFGNNQPFPNPDATNPQLPPSQQTEARKIPSYTVFAQDRAALIGSSNLAQDQLALANAFVQRPEFLAKYPSNFTAAQFVDALLANINNDSGADLTSQRAALIAQYNQGGTGMALYRVTDDNLQNNPINNRAFIDAEYNRAFVFGEYAGYLRRNADVAGFLFWLGQVTSAPLHDVPKQHAMVCSFITSTEYQLRFSSVVTHTNQECP